MNPAGHHRAGGVHPVPLPLVVHPGAGLGGGLAREVVPGPTRPLPPAGRGCGSAALEPPGMRIF